MCYAVLLSTTSDRNLAVFNTEQLRFEKEMPLLDDCARLVYPHRWHVSSRAGCSCGFRHLHCSDLGFDEPVDWYEEEDLDLGKVVLYDRLPPRRKQHPGILQLRRLRDRSRPCGKSWWPNPAREDVFRRVWFHCTGLGHRRQHVRTALDEIKRAARQLAEG